MSEIFSIDWSIDNQTKNLNAIYFRFRTGTVARTKELADGRMMADYDRRGRLLGIEMIAPCSANVLEKIDIDKEARDFIKRGVPREFVTGKMPSLVS